MCTVAFTPIIQHLQPLSPVSSFPEIRTAPSRQSNIIFVI